MDGGAFDVQPVVPDAPVAAPGTDPEAERMFFDYLTKTYRMFLNGDDHYESMQAELASNFEAKHGVILSDIESLRSKILAIESELKVFDMTEASQDLQRCSYTVPLCICVSCSLMLGHAPILIYTRFCCRIRS